VTIEKTTMVDKLYLKETREGHNNSSKKIQFNFMVLQHIQFDF